jgi:hypothetical protein
MLEKAYNFKFLWEKVALRGLSQEGLKNLKEDKENV